MCIKWVRIDGIIDGCWLFTGHPNEVKLPLCSVDSTKSNKTNYKQNTKYIKRENGKGIPLTTLAENAKLKLYVARDTMTVNCSFIQSKMVFGIYKIYFCKLKIFLSSEHILNI